MSAGYSSQLPLDIIRRQLYELSVNDIMSLCTTEKYIQVICNDDRFWREYVITRYNITHPWKQLARLYEREKPITVYDDNQDMIIGKIIINPEMNLADIINEIRNMVPEEDPELFTIQFSNPLRSMDTYSIKYERGEIFYLNEYNKQWYIYNNNNIGEDKMYDLIWQIRINDYL